MRGLFGVVGFVGLVFAVYLLSGLIISSLGWLIWGIALMSMIAYAKVYNEFVRLQNMVKNAWANVDVLMQRRFDLVNSLVSTVRGYAKHEITAFERVTELRGLVVNPRSTLEAAHAQDVLTSVLKTLFAVVEAYPELKANQNFLLLQEELSDIESNIADMREAYNGALRQWNVYCESFPWGIVACLQGFRTQNYIVAPNGAERPVSVGF